MPGKKTPNNSPNDITRFKEETPVIRTLELHQSCFWYGKLVLNFMLFLWGGGSDGYLSFIQFLLYVFVNSIM